MFLKASRIALARWLPLVSSAAMSYY